MGLSTSKVSEGGGGTPKVIQAGQPVFKIHSVELSQAPWMEKDKAYSIMMQCESRKPEEGFVGFKKDVNDESKGNYDGPVGRIKTSNWPYKDGTTKSGIEVSRDTDIMIAINRICKAVGSTWMQDVDNKYDTIEELVEGFNKDKPFKDKFVKATVACREYARPGNEYPGQDLYLAKGKKGFVVLEGEGTTPSKLLPYNEADHYSHYVPEETDSFAGDEVADDTPEFDV